MACVLARPAAFQNPFAGQHVTGEKVQNLTWNKFDWISAPPPHTPSPDPVIGTGPTRDSGSNELLGTRETKCDQEIIDSSIPSPNVGDTNRTDARKGVKRKVSEIDCDFEEILRPPKRISPFFNTPKERKDEKKKILKLSVHKIKLIENAELCLRKSVLINNTMKRMRHELKKDSNSRKRKRRLGQGMLSNDCVAEKYLVDDPFLSGIHEKITDDMTDVLMSNLEKTLGADISSNSNAGDTTSGVNSPVQQIPKASETEAMDQTETCSVIDQSTNETDKDETGAIVNESTTSVNVNFTNKNETNVETIKDCDTPVDAIKVNLPLENNEVMVETLIDNNMIYESIESSLNVSERTR